MDLAQFTKEWASSSGSERASFQHFLLDLCDVLGVARPAKPTGDPTKDHYTFEHDAKMPLEGGAVSLGRMDLYKQGCFILEAKQGSNQGDKKPGIGRRETPAWTIAMRDACGQALQYAQTLDAPPPFIVVCDVGYCFDLYAVFDGSLQYRPFPDAQHYRVHLADLGKHLDLFRALFTEPLALDPARRYERVTREVAEKLAELARDLEAAGHAPENVATFLMRWTGFPTNRVQTFVTDRSRLGGQAGLAPGRDTTDAGCIGPSVCDTDRAWMATSEGWFPCSARVEHPRTRCAASNPART
ncbi:MAG: hypothetical protein HY901_35060 [Deltaproteobacteria bacterium]|nr:hypothetical protein [Deltaproteobacteria bacterium]